MTAPKIIASLLLLCSCAKVQDVATKVAGTAEQCSYLNDYAKEAQDALISRDLKLALTVVDAAYYKSLETKDAPCAETAKDLAKSVYAAVVQAVKDQGEVN